MRYGTEQYARALYEALEGKEGAGRRESIKGFVKVLQRDRALPRLDPILRRFEKIHLKEKGLVKVHVETPEGPSDVLKREISRIFGDAAVISERSDPRHIAGVKIVIDDSIVIDATAKTRLESLSIRT